mmetsp:Transcript_50506/g.156289  ORF Transcript_50506/g.156289 Transcript_50506/m.156289 type:complete len:690 (+) Transcript_50506:43-2112(+)
MLSVNPCSLPIVIAVAAFQPSAATRSLPRPSLIEAAAPSPVAPRAGGGRERGRLRVPAFSSGGLNRTAPEHTLARAPAARGPERAGGLHRAYWERPSAVLQYASAAWMSAASRVRTTAAICQLDELVAYILTGVSAFFVLWTYGTSAEKVLRRRAQVEEELGELEQNYLSSVGQLEGQLEGLQECSALLAERNFEGKARSFRRFVHGLHQDLVRSPSAFLGGQGPEKLLEPLRRFIKHWLMAYSYCTPTPHKELFRVVLDDELDACGDAIGLTMLLDKRLDHCDLNLLGTNMAKAEELMKGKAKPGAASDDTEKLQSRSCTWFRFGLSGVGWSSTSTDADIFPLEVRLGLCSTTLLSNTHVILMACLGKCLLLMTFEACEAKLAFAALLAVAACGLVAAGIRIEFVDSVACAERQLARLQKATAEAEQVKDLILDFHKHSQEVTELWQLRTEPRLEHLEELYERLGDAPPEHRLEFLDACNFCLDEVAHCVGPVDAWLGDRACSQRARDLFCRQLRAHTDAIDASGRDPSGTESVLERLRRPVFGLLVARMHSARALRNADFSIMGLNNMSDPFVECKVGEQEFTTHTVRNSLDPVWDSEPFAFEAGGGDSTLRLTVWDEDKLAKKSDCLGAASLDMRTAGLASGRWHRQQVALQPSHDKPAQGELVFEIYFADAVPQADWEAAEPPGQ